MCSWLGLGLGRFSIHVLPFWASTFALSVHPTAHMDVWPQLCWNGTCTCFWCDHPWSPLLFAVVAVVVHLVPWFGLWLPGCHCGFQLVAVFPRRCHFQSLTQLWTGRMRRMRLRPFRCRCSTWLRSSLCPRWYRMLYINSVWVIICTPWCSSLSTQVALAAAWWVFMQWFELRMSHRMPSHCDLHILGNLKGSVQMCQHLSKPRLRSKTTTWIRPIRPLRIGAEFLSRDPTGKQLRVYTCRGAMNELPKRLLLLQLQGAGSMGHCLILHFNGSPQWPACIRVSRKILLTLADSSLDSKARLGC